MLTIASIDPLPENVQAGLMTTLNSPNHDVWMKLPFLRTDQRTLTCAINSVHPGLHSFRAEFTLDGGTTWLRDTVPDAWILIDPPQVDALRLYTLIPAVSGSISDWKNDLKRIAGMGFNAVHLLPITPMDTSQSPYAAKELFDIDHRYLLTDTKAEGLGQLEDFIAEAKSQGIRLVFDLVMNHVGVQSTIAQQAPDWIMPDQNQPDGFQRARYWCDDGWRTWKDLVLINYEHPSEAIRAEIRSYMTNYALFWAKYANDTNGFVRFDNLHSSDPNFVASFTAALHTEYPEVGILAEYFTDERTLLRTGPAWGLNLNLATPWHSKFVPQLRDYLRSIHRVAGSIRYFMPITSHDSGTPAEEFGIADSTIPRYVTAALLGTGATGMPQGVEFGEAHRIDFIGHQPRMTYPAQARFARFIARVNAVLAEHPAFRRGDNCWFIDNAHPAIIAAFRRDTGERAIGYLVACNFDTTNPQRITIELGPILRTDGPFNCRELLSGEDRLLPNSRLELLLSPCEAQVLQFVAPCAQAFS